MSFFSSMDALLAPMSWATFEKEILGQESCHITNRPSGLPLFSWQALSDLLSMTSLWSASTLRLVERGVPVPPALYCQETLNREGQPVLQPLPEKVMAFWRQGAGLVCNDVSELTPSLQQVARLLGRACGARVLANTYATSQQIPGFKSHFDTHDVWAFQVEGEKKWHLYENRAPHPVNHPLFNQLDDAYHAAHKGALAKEIVMNPGDILYLPRGVYHDACAISEHSLHVTFSVMRPTGLDLVSRLFEELLHDPLARQDIPLETSERQNYGQKLGDLARTFLAHPELGTPLFIQETKEDNEVCVLPQKVDPSFRRALEGAKVGQEGKNYWLIARDAQVPIPQGWEKPMAWILQKESFRQGVFFQEFPSKNKGDMTQFLVDLMGMGVLEPDPS